MPKRKRPPSKDFVADEVPEVHERLLEYVLANNARLSKVKIAKLPHGIGIVASEKIRKNQEITFIPTSLLVNLHDIPLPNSSPVKHPTTVHSSLAAYVANKKRDGDDPFISILPSDKSFRTSMPMFWKDEVLDQCSPWIIEFAKRQQKKLENDHAHARKMHVDAGSKLEFTKEEFEWAWAVVNTRTIYYRPKKWYKIPAEDCMTMCPFIDYYNHGSKSEETCSVSFSTDGLYVTTQKAYEPGEEIFVTYGEYSNDHLLVEYGFGLPNNRSDNVNIDYLVTSKLSPKCLQLLKDLSFDGYAFTISKEIYSGSDLTLSVDGDGYSGYYFDTAGVCYRTMTALRLAVILDAQLPSAEAKESSRYRDFKKLLDGEMEEDDYTEKYEADEKKVKSLVDDIIASLESSAEEKITKLEDMVDQDIYEDEKDSIGSARSRWEQIRTIIDVYKGTPQ